MDSTSPNRAKEAHSCASRTMKNGTLLVEPVSGMKLMVVEEAITGFNPKAEEFTFQGRQLLVEESVAAGAGQTAAVITCDPGDRSKAR